MGESVAEATVIKWTKKPGDQVEADETVMEIATDKVDSDVPSPVTGKLLEQLCKENDVVQVGAVIAIIETDVPEEVTPPVPAYQPPVEASTPPPVPQYTEPVKQEPQPTYTQPAQPVYNAPREEHAPPVPFTDQLEQKTAKADDLTKGAARFYSPLVKNIAAQEGISNSELDQIPGTGAEGRLTKDDLLNYIQNKYQAPAATNGRPATPVEESASSFSGPEGERADDQTTGFKSPETTTAPPPVETPQQPSVTDQPKAEPAAERIVPGAAKQQPVSISASTSGTDEIIEMDRMRRLIADHMVMSKQTSPHVTSFVEADVTNLVLWRENIKGPFEKREGEKITFTPLFIEAVVRAIKDFPMINVQVNGNQIIKKKDINISMATALPSGNLIVPVIRRADELNLVGLTKAVNDLANRARNNKLKPDDVQDGTFTITNVGSFGNVMGTPIINQPQVAILAVGAIRKKPAVIETLQGDMIGIRHMMFLSLSYDHRVVDGMLGGSFVRRVADYLENWDPGREI